MKRLLFAFFLLISTTGFCQGPLYKGDSTQRTIDRGQIGSTYGIVNAIKDTSSIPVGRRTVGLTIFKSGIAYVWIGTKWISGSVPSSLLGEPNGVATLGPDGFVPFEQLPFTDPLDFHGFYNAFTDTPNLTDGIGNKGDMYICIDTGTQNLGHGPIDFLPGDIIIADPEVVYNIVTRLGITQVPADWNAVPGAPNSIVNKPTTLGGYGITDAVPSSRTITINGVAYDLTTGRSWSVGTVTSFVVAGYMNGVGTYTGTGTFSPDTAAGKLATKTDLNSYYRKPLVNTQTGTTYTIQASDYGKVIAFTNSSAVTVTLPSGLGDFHCTIQQDGTGQVTVSAGSGVTIRNADSFTKTSKQYANFSILPTNVADTYITQGAMQ